ncbi:MAG: flagellar brake protein [Myxococcales bacterium]|nr:flagellar brake protein [Myxococcales bacterium]
MTISGIRQPGHTAECRVIDPPHTEPRFVVGLQLMMGFNGESGQIRSIANVLGWQKPEYLMTAIPRLDSTTVKIVPSAEVVLRYILDGTVYGFSTRLIGEYQSPVPMWVLEYPKSVEFKNLRRSPRVSLELPVTCADGMQMRTVDISANGALLTGNAPLSIGDILRISFNLPDGTAIDNLEADVVRVQKSRTESLFGINFHETSDQLAKIARFIYQTE